MSDVQVAWRLRRGRQLRRARRLAGGLASAALLLAVPTNRTEQDGRTIG